MSKDNRMGLGSSSMANSQTTEAMNPPHGELGATILRVL